MLYSCPTDTALLLVACQKNSNEPILFASTSGDYGGLVLNKTSGDSIFVLLTQMIESVFAPSFEKKALEIFPHFQEPLPLAPWGSSTLYLSFYRASPPVTTPLVKISDILRRLPANKDRLAYLKAWQVLMGVEKEVIKVLDKQGPHP